MHTNSRTQSHTHTQNTYFLSHLSFLYKIPMGFLWESSACLQFSCSGSAVFPPFSSHLMLSLSTGTSVMKVTASDADDPTYGSSARVVYSVLDGEKFFTVGRHTGTNSQGHIFCGIFLMSFLSFPCLRCQMI